MPLTMEQKLAAWLSARDQTAEPGAAHQPLRSITNRPLADGTTNCKTKKTRPASLQGSAQRRRSSAENVSASSSNTSSFDGTHSTPTRGPSSIKRARPASLQAAGSQRMSTVADTTPAPAARGPPSGGGGLTRSLRRLSRSPLSKCGSRGGGDGGSGSASASSSRSSSPSAEEKGEFVELYWETRFKQGAEATRLLQVTLDARTAEVETLRAAVEEAAAARATAEAKEAAAQEARDDEVCDLRAAVAALQQQQELQQQQAEVMQLAEEAARAAASHHEEEEDEEQEEQTTLAQEEEEESGADEVDAALREALCDAQAQAETAAEMMEEAEAEAEELRGALEKQKEDTATLRFLNEVLAQEMGEVRSLGKAKRAQLRARHERELARIAAERAKEQGAVGAKIEAMTGQLKEGLMKSLVKIRGLEAKLAEAEAHGGTASEH